MQSCSLQLPAFRAPQCYTPISIHSHCRAFRSSPFRQPRSLCGPRHRRGAEVKVHASVEFLQVFNQLKVWILCMAMHLPNRLWSECQGRSQGGASSVALFLETAPPPLYLVYMLAAGFGLPVSIGRSLSLLAYVLALESLIWSSVTVMPFCSVVKML